MYKHYLQSTNDPLLTDSFYYDQKLPLGTPVMHSNIMHEVIHSRQVSDIYTTEQIKEQFIHILNKTYLHCTDNEMDYIIEKLDQETFYVGEQLNNLESSNTSFDSDKIYTDGKEEY